MHASATEHSRTQSSVQGTQRPPSSNKTGELRAYLCSFFFPRPIIDGVRARLVCNFIGFLGHPPALQLSLSWVGICQNCRNVLQISACDPGNPGSSSPRASRDDFALLAHRKSAIPHRLCPLRPLSCVNCLFRCYYTVQLHSQCRSSRARMISISSNTLRRNSARSYQICMDGVDTGLFGVAPETKCV